MSIHTAAQFSVDSYGAYVTELYDEAGRAILFPRTQIGEKTRGGSHVCVPNFGPDYAGVLAQHGFGRTVEWQVTTSDDKKSVHCAYEVTEGDAAGLRLTLDYQLLDRGFRTTLTLKNEGQSSQAVAPGFHPYFTIDPAEVRLNGEAVDYSQYEPFRQQSAEQMTLQTAGRTITLSSPNLHTFVVWSDARGPYLCIEPTLYGDGFDGSNPATHQQLAPGEVSTYSYDISWGRNSAHSAILEG